MRMRNGHNRKNAKPVPDNRPKGRHPIGSLCDGQAFQTLLTGRIGYIVGRDGRHEHLAVRVILNADTLDEQNIHPFVMVEGL